nr:60S ribosomal protein L34 [Tanacetum cinerariifolium]
MTLIGLLKKLKRAFQFPIKGIYFLIPGKELSNGLVEIKNDSNLAECIALAFKNKKLAKSIWNIMGEDDVVILNRTINVSFLNKLCNGTFISDHTNIRECSEPTDKELLINSDDEDVDRSYKVVNGVLYPEFALSLPWNEMKPTLGFRFEHPSHEAIDPGPSTAGGSAATVDKSGPTGVQMEATVIEDLIEDFKNEIPTQISKTSMKEVVEASIAAGTLNLAGLKRMRKSKRIANRAKVFKFGKDGAGCFLRILKVDLSYLHETHARHRLPVQPFISEGDMSSPSR